MSIIKPKYKIYLQILDVFRWLLLGILGLGLVCAILYGPVGPTPYFEWIGTLVMFNFFVVAAVLDDYVECVVVKDSGII